MIPLIGNKPSSLYVSIFLLPHSLDTTKVLVFPFRDWMSVESLKKEMLNSHISFLPNGTYKVVANFPIAEVYLLPMKGDGKLDVFNSPIATYEFLPAEYYSACCSTPWYKG